MSENQFELKTKASFDANHGNINLVIDWYSVWENLSEEEKFLIAESIGWDVVLQEAENRLVGESANWGGKDDSSRLYFLSRIEDELLKSGYKWAVLSDLKDAAKKIYSHQRLYWEMYHDEDHKDFFRQWMKEHGIESEYGKFERVDDFEKWVDGEFKKFNESKQNVTAMLGALYEVADYLSDNDGFVDEDSQTAEIIRLVNDAIAKAEGE